MGAASRVSDALHARLLFLFADVLCVFADDFSTFEGPIGLLKRWAFFGRACDNFAETRPRVIIVRSTTGSHASPTFDVLEKMDIDFELLQQDLMRFFASIIVLNLVNDEISPLARYRPLRDLIKRQSDETQHAREVQGCLFSAVHLQRFFDAAVSHTARFLRKPYNFALVNCIEPPRTPNTDQRMKVFFKLTREYKIPRGTVTSYVASALLLAFYPPEVHSKSSWGSMYVELIHCEGFDPYMIYDSLCEPSITVCLESAYCKPLLSRQQSLDIKTQFCSLFSKMCINESTASEIHAPTLDRHGSALAWIRSNSVCLLCLRRKLNWLPIAAIPCVSNASEHSETL